MKLLYRAIALGCLPIVLAGNDAVYPTEKIAAFVFEKVDVTTLPPAIRARTVKGKKTFSDYGYTARELSIHRKGCRRFRSKYWRRRKPASTFV